MLIFRDASFNGPSIYVGVIAEIGAIHRAYQLVCHGRRGWDISGTESIDRQVNEAIPAGPPR